MVKAEERSVAVSPENRAAQEQVATPHCMPRLHVLVRKKANAPVTAKRTFQAVSSFFIVIAIVGAGNHFAIDSRDARQLLANFRPSLFFRKPFVDRIADK